jgi:lipopolysaccharide/colanic/teichoic acid biosynthesis glycosyltransferase
LSVQLETGDDRARTPPAIEAIPLRHDGLAEVVRRFMDVTLSAVLLVLLSPLIAAMVVLIRVTSLGPAIFRQVRLGQGGRPFVFYKFRGMYVDARERWPELYEYRYSPDELDTLRFHPDRDPRVTRVGRWLRRTSLDEVLNLYNVLKGDMSLVGPRPEIPEMIPYYGRHAAAILSVRPGVTSLAKVTGRDELTFTETLRLDLEYLERRSLRFDLRILGLTVMTVVLQHGVLPG